MATVAGSTDTSVTWSVTEPNGGTITDQGVYTAPDTVDTFHVVATSNADPSRSATATVTVTAVPQVQVTLSPSSATLNPGQTQRFVATVTPSVDNAVDWSVEEQDGGTISADGEYTAASTPGTYHVRATAVVDPTRYARATITVTDVPQVSVTLAPTTVALNPGETQTFTATVSGAANTSVTWSVVEDPGAISVDGVFTAPQITGTYVVVATSVEDPSKSAVATAEVHWPRLSGTVDYAGSATGRIYIVVSEQFGGDRNVGGTSLGAPGDFTVRGISRTGGFTVRAWMDALGTGSFNAAYDPAGTATVYLGSDDLTDVQITLVDPSAVTPPAPAVDGIFPGGDHFGLIYAPVRDNNNGNELADHYTFYCDANPDPGPGAALVRTVRAGGDFVVMGPWTGGDSVYCAAAAVNHGTEGPLSAPLGPVDLSPPVDGNAISGEVSVAAGVTGPLYVIAYSEQLGALITRVANPQATQAYTIDGVADGAWYMIAFVDRADDGRLDATDPVSFFEEPVSVEVAGATAQAPLLVLEGTDARARALVQRWVDVDGSEGYGLRLDVLSNLRLPATVTLLSKPDPRVDVPLDIALGDDGFGPARFSPDTIELGAAPQVGQGFLLDVRFDDGTGGLTTAAITGVPPGVPTPLAPVGTGTTTPTFSWTAPDPAPANYTYSLWLQEANGPDVWERRNLPSSQTSVVYNDDGSAQQPELRSGTTYRWYLTVTDELGNRATHAAEFSTPIVVDVLPAQVTLNPGQQQRFVAVVGGNNPAVTWTITEPGDSGLISNDGTYTAPTTLGTYHVVATSVADPTRFDTAEVTVTDTPQPQVIITPPRATVQMGGTTTFSAVVNGLGDGTVSWSVLEGGNAGTISPDGDYSAPPDRTGIFHVVATSVADPTRTDVATVTVLRRLHSISGVITDPTGATGRIHVAVTWGGGDTQPMAGTSIAAPGPYTIRGLEWGGTFTVRAWRDTLGQGSFNAVADPTGSALITVDDSDATGVDITLTAPAAAAPPEAFMGSVNVGSGELLVRVNTARDPQGQEIADHYAVYLGDAPDVGPLDHLDSQLLVAGTPSTAVFTGLSPGQYWVASTTLVNGVESSPSVRGPYQVAAPSGGFTVDGEVDLGTLTSSGPLYVWLDRGDGFALTVGSPSGVQAFAFSGIPPGDYRLGAWLDRDDDGQAAVTDPILRWDEMPMVTVAAADVTVPAVALNDAVVTARVTSEHRRSSWGESYGYSLHIGVGTALPVAATLRLGLGNNGPVDIGTSMGRMDGRVSMDLWRNVEGGLLMMPGDVYTVDVQLADDSTVTVTPALSAVLTGLPTPTSPLGVTADVRPLFQWDPPDPLPEGAFTYFVGLREATGPGVFWYGPIDSTQTSLDYEDALDTGSLQSGMSYVWEVSVNDANGNRASQDAQFFVE
ncbi:MAG: Ig-like domain-containing protein [Myxococcota bacterium]